MTRHAMPAALLSLLIAAGCADRGDNTTQTTDPNAAPAASEPAPAKPEGSAPEATSGESERERPPAAAPSAARPTRPAPPRAGSSSATARESAAPPRESAPASREAAAPPRSEAASRPAAPRAEFREVTIPAGTALPLELQTELSSETATVETPVRARLTQAVIVDGLTALPAGATVIGEVTSVERAGRVKGRAGLAFAFSRVQAENVSGSLRTNPLAYQGEASKGEDATKIGAGAVGGAIVGGILGGGDGAAKGAAIGGAAGTGVVLATRGKEVKLAVGTDLAATLASPFTVRVRVP